jgi:hypothetical protein
VVPMERSVMMRTMSVYAPGSNMWLGSIEVTNEVATASLTVSMRRYMKTKLRMEWIWRLKKHNARSSYIFHYRLEIGANVHTMHFKSVVCIYALYGLDSA